MIIQTVSLKDPTGRYLSCKPSDASLAFTLFDLDPSCKFFVVPWGAGRTCLKGPNGKFVDLHGNRLRCDGTNTGVGFIFSDTHLQLDNGKYLSNIIDKQTITTSDTATTLVIKSTSFESFSVSTALSVPAITYDVSIESFYSEQPGRKYLALKKSSGTIDIIFSIPYSMDGERNGTVDLIFNHMRDNSWNGVIDVKLNNKPLIEKYAPPVGEFFVQLMSCLSPPSLSGENRLSITLSQGFSGNYYFSDAALVFKTNNGYVRQENSVYALGQSSGSSYNSGKLEDNLRKGDPYLSLEGGSSWSKISFAVREELLGTGNCVIKIQHRRESRTSIHIYFNSERIENRYDSIPTKSFGTSTIPIPGNKLKQSNELVIKPNGGKYFISDVGLDVVSLLPDVTEQNFTTYIKDWILNQRMNIGELNKIPREDFSAWKFVKEAPYWFFLPFLPISPEEISVLFDYYNFMFVSVAFEIRDLENKAREFHRELISTDIPRKNALRQQTAQIFWQKPLDRMAKKYNVKPSFDPLEKTTLDHTGVTEPDVPIIH